MAQTQVVSRLRDLVAHLDECGAQKAIDQVLRKLIPKTARPLSRERVVKDVAWGVASVPPYLWPIVDSRMLQRQRRIRQLGVSYLVYPAAAHTRFEHAIGCCHVMGLLLDSVEEERLLSLGQDTRRQLLLGALLHDVGHMPFSHASESALEPLSDQLRIGPHTVAEVQDRLGDALETKPPRLAVLISILVLLSPPFRSLVSRLVQFDGDVDDACYEVAAFIGGACVGPDRLACTQILSGAVDADRIDFIVRDARACGVPVSIDAARLMGRCKFTDISVAKLPKTMHDQFSQAEKVTVFSTDLSGANALEEMAVSRFILYDRVYNHHTTKAWRGPCDRARTTSCHGSYVQVSVVGVLG